MVRLSLDVHVGEHLMRECFLGVLRGKTRVLVTHHTPLLKQASEVRLGKQILAVVAQFENRVLSPLLLV